MFTRKFWLDTLERVVRTFFQTLAAGLTAFATGKMPDNFNFTKILMIAGLGALYSLASAVGAPAIQTVAKNTDSSAPIETPSAPAVVDSSAENRQD